MQEVWSLIGLNLKISKLISNTVYLIYFQWNSNGIELTGGGRRADGDEVEVEVELLAEDAGEIFAIEDGDKEDEGQESEEVRGEARFSKEGGGGGDGRRRLHFREERRREKKKAKLEVLMTKTKTFVLLIYVPINFWFIIGRLYGLN